MTGARQTGKTTLAKSLELEHSRHTTLDKALYLKAAQDDAAGFLIRSPGETVIIDEVQKVPALLDEIKILVDENDERGQYLLTGSANLRFAKTSFTGIVLYSGKEVARFGNGMYAVPLGMLSM